MRARTRLRGRRPARHREAGQQIGDLSGDVLLDNVDFTNNSLVAPPGNGGGLAVRLGDYDLTGTFVIQGDGSFGLNGFEAMVGLTSTVLGPTEPEPLVSLTMRTFGPADGGTGGPAD